MTMPESVMIGGVPHKIVICKDDFTVDSEHLGSIQYKKCEIHIADDMPEEMKMLTLIHEWVHGALFAIGYDDLRNDEKFVQNLAMQINQSFNVKQEAE